MCIPNKPDVSHSIVLIIAGATDLCVWEDYQEMTIAYDKLVRDRIPQVLKAAGKGHRTRVAAADEFERYATKKLQEELDEFKESRAIEELADLLEVAYAIAQARGVRAEELDRIRAQKTQERGAFNQRLILVEAD